MEPKITTHGERMKNWLELVTNPDPIRAIFGSEIPTLDDIDLHEIILHHDGPKVILRFDLKDFPKQPPKKWLAGQFNKVQLKIQAFGLQNLKLDGFQNRCIVDLTVFEDKGIIHLGYESAGSSLALEAVALIVDGITAYADKRVI